MQDNESFAQYLGVDYQRKGNLIYITCPYHADNHPSMVIYPNHDRACHCFPCGTTVSWEYLAMAIKGITYPEALKELGNDTLPVSEIKRTIKAPSPMSFCDEPNPRLTEAFTERMKRCSDEYPAQLTEWLEKKHLLDTAKKLRWKWQNSGVFRHWSDGLVIPYIFNGKCVYARFRGLQTAEQGGMLKFEKPKGPMNVPIQPYFSTFRKNDTVFVTEGECLTPDTEVLTEKGWVRFDEYDGHSKVAQWDEGVIEYVTPQAFLVKDHVNGRIFHYESKGVSFATTPKHRICGFRGDWDSMNVLVDTAEELFEKRTDRKLPRVGDADGEGLPLTDDQIRLAVAVSADFSERKYSWYCSLAKPRKEKRLDQLLQGSGIKYKKYKKDSRGQYGWQIWEKPWYLRKNFDHNWLAKMSLHQKQVMLAEFKYWDGNKVKDRTMEQYSTIEYDNAVFVQTLAHLSGVTATIVKRHGDTNFKNDFTWYVVHILWGKKYSSLQNYWSHTAVERYTGKVYCVSVPSTFFLIRHNGHISVTGNTDAASVWSYGMSAIGIPGAMSRKAINTTVAFIADRPYIKRVVACGDNDEAGKKMNSLIRSAMVEFEVNAEFLTYTVESQGEKADLNDDHVAGVFKPPKEWGMYYKGNFDRNFPDSVFGNFVNDIDRCLTKCEDMGVDPWENCNNGVCTLVDGWETAFN